MAVSKDKSTDKVNAYRVHYKQWSSRFDEWVIADRVVEPSNHNLEVQVSVCAIYKYRYILTSMDFPFTQHFPRSSCRKMYYACLQEELLEEWIAQKEGVPEDLDYLIARNYLYSKRRARKSGLPLSFSKALSVGPGASAEDKAISNLKAALLTIEAALPQGSVDTSSSGSWNSESSAYWKLMVENSPGLASLMGCVILLEDAIDKTWFRLQAKHLIDCLPKHWKAISDASVSSIAMRIWLLDRAVMYGTSGSRSSTSGTSGKSRKSR